MADQYHAVYTAYKQRAERRIAELEAEIERLRPVVDAAMSWLRYELRGLYVHDHDKALIDAVRAYQAGSPLQEKTDAQS